MSASHTQLIEQSPLPSLVRRARRRLLTQLLLSEGALALSLIFAGAILLLLVGAEILDWRWLIALAAVGIGLAVYRLRNKIASRYNVARILDRNLALNDVLSTALYFAENPDRARTPQDIVEQQRDMAQEQARSANVRQGLPFALSRSVYAGGALALVIVGLIGLRYGFLGSMDLRHSLVQVAMDNFFGPNTRTADARKKPNDPRAKDWANPATMKYDPWQSQALDQTGAPETSLDTIDTPNVDNSNNAGPANDPKATGNQSKDNPDQSADNQENSERSAGGNDQSPDGSQGASKDGAKAGNPPNGGNKNGKNAGDNSSLSDKMRDALANLLSKMKPQQNGGGKQSQQNQGSSQQNAQNRQNSPNAAPTPGRPQPDAMSSPDGQAGQDAQSGEQAKAGQGKSNGKGDEHNNTQEGKSGIGRTDGDKSIKEAEQQAAMGKISEIIGKRAQNVSGEVMVEVSSGNQQLKTQYSQKKAAHSDTGGEINRDEVPLAYQQFVQQYFEEVRKQPGAAKAKKPDAAKKSGPS